MPVFSSCFTPCGGLSRTAMRLPEGLIIVPAHFLNAPEDGFRGYVEGDKHQHHVVKIDFHRTGFKRKLFGSFTKVKHCYNFETSELQNQSLCLLTTASSEDCNHAVSSKFTVLRKRTQCPHVNGALALNLHCQSLEVNEDIPKGYFHAEDEDYLWDQMEREKEYKIKTKFNGETIEIPFNFQLMCKFNGKLRLGSIDSQVEQINCKAFTSFVRLSSEFS